MFLYLGMDTLRPLDVSCEDFVVGGTELITDTVRMQDTGRVVENLSRWADWRLLVDTTPISDAEGPQGSWILPEKTNETGEQTVKETIDPIDSAHCDVQIGDVVAECERVSGEKCVSQMADLRLEKEQCQSDKTTVETNLRKLEAENAILTSNLQECEAGRLEDQAWVTCKSFSSVRSMTAKAHR
jgi:hypothetical protein